MQRPTPLLLANPESLIQGSNKSLNYFQDGRFYLCGVFDETIMTEVLPNLVQQIEARKNQKNAIIQVYIDSVGGIADCTKNLVALFEIAKKEGIVVETYVFGKAFSAGSVLACAGTKGRRFIGPQAIHLCHLGSAGTKRIHNDVELERESVFVKAHFDYVRSHYRKYAKIKNLEKVIHDDSLFIRGEDIIKNGLADKMV